MLGSASTQCHQDNGRNIEGHKSQRNWLASLRCGTNDQAILLPSKGLLGVGPMTGMKLGQEEDGESEDHLRRGGGIRNT